MDSDLDLMLVSNLLYVDNKYFLIIKKRRAQREHVTLQRWPTIQSYSTDHELWTDCISCKNGGLPRYVLNQLKIFVAVGKDIKIVTPVK
jgi:hypothetical protein